MTSNIELVSSRKMAPAWIGLLCLCALMVQGCVTQSRRAILDDLAASRKRSGEDWASSIALSDGAEGEAEGELSLEDALKLAMKHNKQLQTVLQEREIGRGLVLESYAAALPNLSALANYTRLDEVTSLEVGGQSSSFGVLDNYSANLNVTQPIIHGAAIPATMQAAKLRAILGDEKIRKAAEDVIYNVVNSYCDALLAAQLLEVRKDAVASASRYVEDIQKKKLQGMASEYSVLRTKVELSNLSAELISQQNALHMANTILRRAIGISQAGDLILTDELVYFPLNPNLEDALRAASQRRPDILQAELQVMAQREALRIAKSDFWPKVDVFFNQEWAQPAPRKMASDEWGDAWSAGAAVSLPIFDGFLRRGRLIQEKARLKQAEAALISAEEQALLDVKQAVLNVEDAESFLASQRMNLQHATEGLRLLQAGYKEGVNSELEVMDGETALTRAQALHYQAIHAHTIARLYLQKAMGTLAPEPGFRDVALEPEDPRKQDPFDESSILKQ